MLDGMSGGRRRLKDKELSGKGRGEGGEDVLGGKRARNEPGTAREAKSGSASLHDRGRDDRRHTSSAPIPLPDRQAIPPHCLLAISSNRSPARLRSSRPSAQATRPTLPRPASSNSLRHCRSPASDLPLPSSAPQQPQLSHSTPSILTTLPSHHYASSGTYTRNSSVLRHGRGRRKLSRVSSRAREKEGWRATLRRRTGGRSRPRVWHWRHGRREGRGGR